MYIFSKNPNQCATGKNLSHHRHSSPDSVPGEAAIRLQWNPAKPRRRGRGDGGRVSSKPETSPNKYAMNFFCALDKQTFAATTRGSGRGSSGAPSPPRFLACKLFYFKF